MRIVFESIDNTRDAVFDQRHMEVDEQAKTLVGEPEVSQKLLLVNRDEIRNGKREPAQRGLCLYRLNLEYQREWDGTWYAVQQVAPVVAEEEDRFVVVTVYAFYF